MIHPSPKPKRKNKAAAKRAKQSRIYGTQEFRDWLHRQPCLWCASHPVEQAHFGKHAIGKKLDWTQTGPLCTARWGHLIGCHDRLDRRGNASTWFTADDRTMLMYRLAQFHARWGAYQHGR